MKAFIYDLETGGTNPRKHSPLQVGVCVSNIDTGEILEKYESLIKLDDYIVEQEALEVNKISIQDCRNSGKIPEEIGDDLLDIWTKHGCFVIGGHNTFFDKQFLARGIYKIDPDEIANIFTYRELDSYPCIQLMIGNENTPPGTSLKQAIKYLKIDMSDIKGGFHGALYDAIAASKVLHKFRKILGATKCQ